MLKFTYLKILGLGVILLAFGIHGTTDLFLLVFRLGLFILLLDFILTILIKDEKANALIQKIISVIAVSILLLLVFFLYYLKTHW